jgi:heme exporter protein B
MTTTTTTSKTRAQVAQVMKSTPFLRTVLIVAAKDIRTEFRTRELVNAMTLFSIISVLIFSFSMELDRLARESSVGGVLWVTIAYAGILGLGRSLAAEKDKGSLDAMLLAPIQRSALFYGKAIGNFIFTVVVALMMMFLLTVLFDINLLVGKLLVVVLLGCLGFASTGTLIASISVHAKAREMLLPILLLPVVLPIILSATRATAAILTEKAFSEWGSWIGMLGVMNIIFLVTGFILFDFIVEE